MQNLQFTNWSVDTVWSGSSFTSNWSVDIVWSGSSFTSIESFDIDSLYCSTVSTDTSRDHLIYSPWSITTIEGKRESDVFEDPEKSEEASHHIIIEIPNESERMFLNKIILT